MRAKAMAQVSHAETKDGNSPVAPLLSSAPGRALGRIFSLQGIDRLYRQTQKSQGSLLFLESLLENLNIDLQIPDEDRGLIPSEGPVVVTANHPFGALDGIILMNLLKSVRPDAKVMANYLLGRIEEIADLMILVDPFPGKDTTVANFRPMREAVRWLKDGGMVGMFPSGEVSHVQWKDWNVSDSQWTPLLARIVRLTRATVLPVFFSGSNSRWFQIAGLVHPRLRTAMLPREILNKTNQRIRVRIGRPIPFERLEKKTKHGDLVQFLRFKTYMLSQEKSGFFDGQALRSEATPRVTAGPRCLTPGGGRQGNFSHQIDFVTRERLLVDNQDFGVYWFQGKEAPAVLETIGRLREITFRQAGEGTGKEIDLDRFDEYYHHVFVWNKTRQEIVGAYRLGLVDRIVEEYGLNGLYSRTLFRFGERFLEKIHPAVELGRSFVRAEYQKTFQSLMLLWKGIGRFVVARPRYRVMFGPVSISRDYHEISRCLITLFFQEYKHDTSLARFVKPLRPLPKPSLHRYDLHNTRAMIRNLNDLSSLIQDVEEDSKGLPILFKQYSKLGGKTVGFSLDPDFGHVLDALMVVDLSLTDRKILEKYMGPEGAANLVQGYRVQARNDFRRIKLPLNFRSKFAPGLQGCVSGKKSRRISPR